MLSRVSRAAPLRFAHLRFVKLACRRRLAHAAAAPPKPDSPSLLGTSVGITLGALTASLVAWPLADLVIAPMLIIKAMQRESDCWTVPEDVAPKDAQRLRDLSGCENMSAPARFLVLAGGTHQQRTALAREACRGRPVVRLSLREATSPHALQMSLISSLYGPLRCVHTLEALGIFWLCLFDMLIPDHDFTRHRDFCVVLSQTRRAMHILATRSTEQTSSRPLVLVEHLHVPTGSASEPGGAGLAPMLRTLRQWLCAVSVDTGLADVLVLAPGGSPAAEAAATSWRSREVRSTCAERAVLRGGAVAIALTQPEAVEKWMGAIRLDCGVLA